MRTGRGHRFSRTVGTPNTSTLRSRSRGHAGHGLELLVVLLAEHGVVRPALREQLGDDGGDAAEEMRPEAVLEIGHWPVP